MMVTKTAGSACSRSLSSHTVHDTLNFPLCFCTLDIVGRHASDASSSAVRAGALTAITMLLDSEESHAVLRALLPSMGNLIHDKVERVRLATVRLLHKIKSVRTIKYYHVVPVMHLIVRLAEEGKPPRNPKNPVASSLTSLMMNSYFPLEMDGVTQMKRSLSLLKTDPLAASVFYTNLPTHMPVNSCTKLVAMLLKCISGVVEASTEHMDDDSDESDVDDSNKENGLMASNVVLMATITDTINTLWEAVSTVTTCACFDYDKFLD